MPNTKITAKLSVLGVMSGTSLDGLDLALTEFILKNGQWHFELKEAICIPYPASIVDALQQAIKLNASCLDELDQEIGTQIGKMISENFELSKIDFISSHGHTVFHQPKKGLTLQIGCGKRINEMTKRPVIYDFRSKDLGLGGQGAPLVPIGDELLFKDYQACINLGGIANISFSKKAKRIAYDIMPFNMALNTLSQLQGKAYDDGGTLASKGKINDVLFKQLNKLPFYALPTPKTLGFEDFEKEWLPLILNNDLSVEDRLATYVAHATQQIATVLNKNVESNGNVLLTGGGAHHSFFTTKLNETFHGRLTIPSDTLINFKEAVIFAFLGVLKFIGENNVLCSVTGANEDSSSGLMVGF